MLKLAQRFFCFTVRACLRPIPSHPKVHQPKITTVTIRDIAKAAGCSRSTVSRALRGERYIKEELRTKVEKTAREMGYKPNPLVASLMATQNKRSARHGLSANIAWINTHPHKKFWHASPYNRCLIHAAKEAALDLGFGFDEVWAFEPGLTGKRLEKILDARGIHGVIVNDACRILHNIGFDFSKYAVAAIGPETIGHLSWHRATVSYRQNIETTYENLLGLGYKKIGYLAPVRNFKPQLIDRFNRDLATPLMPHLYDQLRAEISGYLFCQRQVAKTNRLAPFLYNRDDEPHFKGAIASWLMSCQPDAVICQDNQVMEAAKLAKLTVPEQLAITHTNITGDEADWAGMQPHLDQQAEAAVELLRVAIQANRRGIPKTQQCIYLKSEWRDGWTAPALPT